MKPSKWASCASSTGYLEELDLYLGRKRDLNLIRQKPSIDR